MLTRHRNKIAAVTAALLAVVAGGAAIAATGALSPKQESQAIVNDAAEELGVEPSELSDALKEALKNRVDAAVAAGRLTQAQGTEMKARIDAGDFPLFGLGRGPGHAHFGHVAGLQAAASYLGVTVDALRTALSGGNTLADVARDRDKPVDGLVDAMVAAAKKDLDQAVADGRLTQAQKRSILATLEDRITAKVNGEFGPGPRRPGFGPLPPPASSSAA